jgi:hypothetical protein
MVWIPTEAQKPIHTLNPCEFIQDNLMEEVVEIDPILEQAASEWLILTQSGARLSHLQFAEP